MGLFSIANDSLDNLLGKIWSSLAQGVDYSDNPFTTPVFSSGEKDRIDSRIVILRKVDNKERVLICHSDVRAKKVEQLQHSSAGNWLFWNAEQRIQIRVTTISTVHHLDDIAKQAWQELSPSSRTNYSVSLLPGTTIDQPKEGMEAYERNMSPDPEMEAQWFQNFVVIESRITEIDWLCLSREGHRRARFTFSDSGTEQFWVVP